MAKPIQTTMVLAAGKGTRLRPLTDHTPKPLVKIQGRSLLDRGLDRLVEAGVEKIIVNIHHLGDQIIDHLHHRQDVEIIISDEREKLLDSAGAFVKASADIGTEPIFFLNADTFWLEPEEKPSALRQMAAHFDAEQMDMCLLLTRAETALGHTGGMDFTMGTDGRLARAKNAPDKQGYIYAGAGILNPAIFETAPDTPHSLNLYFDRAIEKGRLWGQILEGEWITVGTIEALEEAEKKLGSTSKHP